MRQKYLLGLFTSIILAIASFFFLFAEILPPTNVDWLVEKKGDVFQHYIAWELFRDAPMTFPPGINTHVGYPIGLALTYTDAMPIMALLLKPFSSLLPDQFQYHGIWTLILFALQGTFSYLLVYRFTRKPLLSTIASVFFILSPTMLNRLFGHMALSAHWQLLAALYLYFVPLRGKWYLWWGGLMGIALATHPYMALMVAAICAAFVLQVFIQHRRLSLVEVLSFVGGMGLWCGVVTYLLGYYQTGDAVAVGYGNFSMNLNALINPFGWSRIIPDLANGPYQSEGMQYLGFGMIMLVLFSLLTLVREKRLLAGVKKYWPVVLMSVTLTVLALSNVMLWGDRTVLSYSIGNGVVSKFLNMFRSGGRLFWPVYYLIFLFAFSFSIYKARLFGLVVVCLALGIQLLDITPKMQELNAYYDTGAYVSVLQDPVWDDLAATYNHIAFVPNLATGHYEEIAMYAAKYGMSLNTMYIARPIEGGESLLQEQIQALETGSLDPSYLYIIVDESPLSIHPSVDITLADGYIIAKNGEK